MVSIVPLNRSRVKEHLKERRFGLWALEKIRFKAYKYLQRKRIANQNAFKKVERPGLCGQEAKEPPFLTRCKDKGTKI